MKPRWAVASRAEQILSRWYPFGVGKIAVQPSSRQNVVVFVSDYADDETTELFTKAITQGLKWELQHAPLIYIFEDKKSSTVKRTKAFNQQVRNKIAQQIAQFAPAAVILLGEVGIDILELDRQENSRWSEYGGLPALLSVDLRLVLNDAKIKRCFWDDLKKIAQFLEQTII